MLKLNLFAYIDNFLIYIVVYIGCATLGKTGVAQSIFLVVSYLNMISCDCRLYIENKIVPL